MSRKPLRLDEIGYWSEVKLDIVRKYASAYSTIMAKQPSRGALMATNSHIEWTEATWNPVTGCDKVSPGCAHCYAERMAKRLQAMGQRNYAKGV